MIVKDLMHVLETPLPISISKITNDEIIKVNDNLTRLDCMVKYGDKFITSILLDKGVEITIK